jgi:GT2 family glycosyltransferase
MDLGVVIIGRNEGQRLVVCLRSIMGSGACVVYVDSGSTDGSAQAARGAGADVVELSPPFTAARARNAGLARLLDLVPGVGLVQFVDGDVELAPGWLPAARAVLQRDRGLAVVCGRLRERHPERSIYNRLCDAEWDRPAGPTPYCGGIAMMRAEAVRAAGGFREDLIAGEEPELCLRLRRAGWRLVRLADDMGWHDAAMVRFSQWWRRSVRAGHGFAEGVYLHGRSRDRYRVRELGSILLWSFVLPATALGAVMVTSGVSLALLAAYPVQWARIVRKERQNRGVREALLIATFMMLGKFAQLQGALRFGIGALRGRASGLIEYKGAPAAAEVGVAAGR